MDTVIKNQTQFVDKITSYVENEHGATNFNVQSQPLKGGLKITFQFNENKFDELKPTIIITKKGASVGSENHNYFEEPIYWENMESNINSIDNMESRNDPMKLFDELIKKVDHFLEDSILSITDRIQKAHKSLVNIVEQKRKNKPFDLLKEIFDEREFQKTDQKLKSNIKTIEELIDKVLNNIDDYIHSQVVKEKEFKNFVYSTIKFLWAVGFSVNEKRLEEKYLNTIYGLHEDDDFYNKLHDEEINKFITDYNKMYN